MYGNLVISLIKNKEGWELRMGFKTTVICYYHEIDKIMDFVYSKYNGENGFKVSKRCDFEYQVSTDDGVIIVKAKNYRQDDSDFMLWFKGRDLGTAVLTKEMEYLNRNVEFLSRVRNGEIFVINSEEL